MTKIDVVSNCASALAPCQARSIGVANFTRRHLKEILSSCKDPPEVIQTEDRFRHRFRHRFRLGQTNNTWQPGVLRVMGLFHTLWFPVGFQCYPLVN